MLCSFHSGKCPKYKELFNKCYALFIQENLCPKYKELFNKCYALFIQENLCPKYKELFNKCYALFIQEKIVYVYTRNGQVFVVINDEENLKKICNDTDFTKLITKFQK